jgi:enoyl-CoA hydratase/carnithine racemase
MTDNILIEQDSGVLIVRMNRPDKKNALTPMMYAAMAGAIERAEQDRELRVVLFTGTDGVFTAGNDMADFLQNQSNDPDRPVNRFIRNMSTTDVPLLAAVDGIAIGIGTTMLLHFDQVFATHRSRFALPFINLGVVPEAGSSQQLVTICGYQRAAELLMLGEPFSADAARDYGIVSRLCSEEELISEAMDFARRLAAKPRNALRATKRLMRRTGEPLLDRVEAEGELFFQCLQSPEAKEIISAFVEKRVPDTSKFD